MTNFLIRRYRQIVRDVICHAASDGTSQSFNHIYRSSCQRRPTACSALADDAKTKRPPTGAHALGENGASPCCSTNYTLEERIRIIKKRRYCRKLAFDEDTLGAIHSFAFCLVHLLWRLWSQMFVLNGLFIAAMTQLYADYDL